MFVCDNNAKFALLSVTILSNSMDDIGVTN